MQMGKMDFSWGKFDLGELWTQNGGKSPILSTVDSKYSNGNFHWSRWIRTTIINGFVRHVFVDPIILTFHKVISRNWSVDIPSKLIETL